MRYTSIIEDLRKELPPIFTRQTASKMIGGIFSAKTLSNFDAAGTGPGVKQHIGKKAVYGKEDFLTWLQEKLFSGGNKSQFSNIY